MLRRSISLVRRPNLARERSGFFCLKRCLVYLSPCVAIAKPRGWSLSPIAPAACRRPSCCASRRSAHSVAAVSTSLCRLSAPWRSGYLGGSRLTSWQSPMLKDPLVAAFPLCRLLLSVSPLAHGSPLSMIMSPIRFGRHPFCRPTSPLEAVHPRRLKSPSTSSRRQNTLSSRRAWSLRRQFRSASRHPRQLSYVANQAHVVAQITCPAALGDPPKAMLATDSCKCMLHSPVNSETVRPCWPTWL